MKHTTFLFVSLAASVLLAGAAPVQPQQDAAKTLKIVSSLPRTGSANAQTTSITNGIRIAIQERGGQVDGYTIVYEDMDDASPQKGNWDPQVESANAKKAVKDPQVVGYIGTYNSGAAKIAMPILNEAGLVMVSPGNTYPGLTKPGTGEANEPMVYRPSGKVTYFRVVPTDDLQGALAAEWSKELGAKRAFVLHDRELYGKGIADVYKATAGKLGIEVVGFEGIDPKASNYRSLVTKIRAANPDIVYFGGTTQTNAGQVLKDMRAGGLKVPFMSPDGTFENAFIKAAGKDNMQADTGGVYITFGGLPSEQLIGRGAEFVKKYQEKYGEIPEAYAVYGYECARVLLDAIDRAETKDRAAILAAVAATKDFEGALGTWSFDANGDTTNRVLSGNTVKGDKFEFVKVLGRGPAAPAAQGK
ncbi:MAG: branched-chain amino acid ABC transporter substrate-binding protein [Phycisphaerales bacterium]